MSPSLFEDIGDMKSHNSIIGAFPSPPGTAVLRNANNILLSQETCLQAREDDMKRFKKILVVLEDLPLELCMLITGAQCNQGVRQEGAP